MNQRWNVVGDWQASGSNWCLFIAGIVVDYLILADSSNGISGKHCWNMVEPKTILLQQK